MRKLALLTALLTTLHAMPAFAADPVTLKCLGHILRGDLETYSTDIRYYRIEDRQFAIWTDTQPDWIQFNCADKAVSCQFNDYNFTILLHPGPQDIIGYLGGVSIDRRTGEVDEYGRIGLNTVRFRGSCELSKKGPPIVTHPNRF